MMVRLLNDLDCIEVSHFAGETVPVTLESALAELIRTLKELHQSTTKKAGTQN